VASFISRTQHQSAFFGYTLGLHFQGIHAWGGVWVVSIYTTDCAAVASNTAYIFQLEHFHSLLACHTCHAIPTSPSPPVRYTPNRCPLLRTKQACGTVTSCRILTIALLPLHTIPRALTAPYNKTLASPFREATESESACCRYDGIPPHDARKICP
jgi:hypothetical protein